MTNHEKFKKLSAAFGQLSGRSHDEAWNDAQGVKDQAKEYIIVVARDNVGIVQPSVSLSSAA